MDIRCPKCAESWDSYGITHARSEGLLTLTETKKLLCGEVGENSPL